jgi:hypothetical protein
LLSPATAARDNPAMKVLNLQCAHRHCFEGWFGSEDDFQSQLVRDLIECPLCADKQISKLPSAPRLNLGGHQSTDASSARLDPALRVEPKPDLQAEAGVNGRSVASQPAGDGPQGGAGDMSLAVQVAFMQALRQVVAKTEDVGQRFAEEARRMHYGEVEARGIRGQTSVREAVELLEEGIELLPLPMLSALKETLQ